MDRAGEAEEFQDMATTALPEWALEADIELEKSNILLLVRADATQ